MPNINKKNDYKFSIKLYPDCIDYDCKLVLVKLCTFFSDWLWVVHDRDIELPSDIDLYFGCGTFQNTLPSSVQYKKTHIHFYGRNNHNCKTSLDSLIKYLGIPYKYSQNRDFEYCSSFESCVLYSIHRNAPSKHQYDISDIHTNIYDIESFFRKSPSLDLQTNAIIQYLDNAYQNGEIISFLDLCKYCSLNHFNIHITKSYFLTQLLRSYHYEV